MNITLHWWMVTLAVFVVGLVIAHYPHRDHHFVRLSHSRTSMGWAIVITAAICSLGNLL